jgi:ABC-type antimicrobial peptide transport system permease subunit
MRKRLIRKGMRFVLVALLLILIASFYHGKVCELFFLSYNSEMRLYQLGIFVAAAIGGYGVVLSILGMLKSARQSDLNIKLMPSLFLIIGVVSLYFYLLVTTFDKINDPSHERLLPGETITI